MTAFDEKKIDSIFPQVAPTIAAARSSAPDRKAGFPLPVSRCCKRSFPSPRFGIAPARDESFFEEVIRENIDLGRPKTVQLIFARKMRRSTVAGRAADAETVVQEIRAAGGQAVAERPMFPFRRKSPRFSTKRKKALAVSISSSTMPGIMQQGLVSVADTDDALFDRLFAINVKGTFNTLRLAAKRLRQVDAS